MLIFGYVGSETKKCEGDDDPTNTNFTRAGWVANRRLQRQRDAILYPETRVAASNGSQVMIRAAGWYVQDFHSWQQMVRGKSEKQ